MSDPRLTTPDLVTLSLLAEQPTHGYQLNQTLEHREVRDWAAISRPQVYYSLRKLKRLGLIQPIPDQKSLGPERQTFATTTKGKQALSDALSREAWTTQRPPPPPPPFLTWLALSTHASADTARSQIARRRHYLRKS